MMDMMARYFIFTDLTACLERLFSLESVCESSFVRGNCLLIHNCVFVSDLSGRSMADVYDEVM